MWVERQPKVQSSFQKLNVDNSCQKTRKIRYYIFEVLSNFTVFLYFVPNILARIVVQPVQMNIHQSNTYRKDLKLATFRQWVKDPRKTASEGPTGNTYPFL